jgi:hypothetical protein
VRVGLHGRQGAELYRLGQCDCCGRPSGREARAWKRRSSLSYFAELLDAFAQEGEAEDPVYRLAVAVIAAAGRAPRSGP